MDFDGLGMVLGLALGVKTGENCCGFSRLVSSWCPSGGFQGGPWLDRFSLKVEVSIDFGDF